MHYHITEFHTGLPVIHSSMSGTPRIALALVIRGGISREKIPGMAKLAGRLLLKGTERRSAEVLARELDARAIDLREVTMSDSQLLLAVFLPQQLNAALDILDDIVFNSTFQDFDKEMEKLAGEIHASLDLPAEMAQDLLTRTMFSGHPYGHTGTTVLDSITKNVLDADDTREWYRTGLDPHELNLTLVGDFRSDEVIPRLDAIFYRLRACDLPHYLPPMALSSNEDVLVTEARPDAQQAHIYQAWLAPPAGADSQAAMAVMNTILGAAGLSSRLFTELRDKQGLAYSVRSQYSAMKQTGLFGVSIGTSPENIAKARAGFSEQITRIQQEPVSTEELNNAKGRLRGSFILSHETTSQYCLDMAINHIYGLSAHYSEKLLEQIDAVTIDEVQTAAQRISTPSVTAIVAREDALPAQ